MFVEIKIFLSLIHGRKKNCHIIISMKRNNQEKKVPLGGLEPASFWITRPASNHCATECYMFQQCKITVPQLRLREYDEFDDIEIMQYHWLVAAGSSCAYYKNMSLIYTALLCI